MIIAIDIESIGFSKQYVTGCLVTNSDKIYHYTKKEDLWNKVLELGAKCKQNKKVLKVLSHNASFDFYRYANCLEKGLTIHNETPFIAKLMTTKYNIKFLDTFGIYRMSLKKAAKLIGMEKQEMPKELEMTKEFITEKAMKKIQEYCEQDTKICLELYKEAIKEGKKNLKLTQVYTIYQMAIATILNDLKTTKGSESLLWNKKYGCIRQTNHKKAIQGAYRGGRVEAFNTGKNIQNLDYIDVNSLYPYALKEIKLPDLRTERHIKKPLDFITKKELLQKIGVSKTLLLNKSNKIPYLPTRGAEESLYAQYGQYLLGHYTHQELEYATKQGYEIIDIEYSIIYEEGTNHFKKIVEKYYNKRKNGTKLQNYFYKQYMNGCIGKFGQRKHGDEILVDNHKKVQKRLEQGYEIINDYEENYIFKRKNESKKEKKYYAPIISALVTAKARTIMQEEYNKIPREDLYYTDTDSIILHSKHRNKYNINPKELGAFKIEMANEEATIYGKKNYSIGEEIKLSGFRKGNITKQEFQEGIVTDKKMIGIRKAQNIEQLGTFTETIVNLNEQKKKHQEKYEEIRNEKILIDHDIENINYFIDIINYILQNNNINKAKEPTHNQLVQST